MASFGGLAKPDRGASLRVISFSHEERLIFDMKSTHVQLTAPSVALGQLLQSRFAEGFLVSSRSADGILTLTREIVMQLDTADVSRTSARNVEEDARFVSTLVQYVVFPPNRAKVAAVDAAEVRQAV